MRSASTTPQAPGDTREPDGVVRPDGAPSARGQRRPLGWGFVVAVLVTLALVVTSLSVGVYDILGADDGAEMFAITRIPRTVALVLSGAVMAMCGLVMQMITQNRFVEPTTTGTTEWAGLGLLCAMIFMPEASLLVRMVFAVVAAFIGTMIFFAFLQRVTLKSSVIVPIVGMMIGSVVGALSTYIALSTNMQQSLGIWFQGSFTSVIRGQYEPMWAVLIVVVVVFVAADRFTAAGMGQDFATNIGLNYRMVVFLGTGLIALASGIVTVVVGNLPFLGLIVPNIVSMFRGDDLRSNLPWVALAGVWIVTVCDIIARVVIMPFEVPVSVILAVIGAVVFVYLLLRTRRA
ncbi:MAG: iron chelate uptake ABC transporter family permease subunit [Propionibacterium sp.]|nr:iron chelate uptake ABC transporter family permease subunit [Propionibacterium sp.]